MKIVLFLLIAIGVSGCGHLNIHKRASSLDELLTGVTQENLHGEVGTGVAVGNEFA